MYLLFSPCIRDPDLRATGITHDRDLQAFARAAERCRKFGIVVRYLPCPETRYLGRGREPGTFASRLDTPAFHALLDTLEDEVRDELLGSDPYALVGVDSSPTCGVNQTWRSDAGKEPGRGVFLSRFPEIRAFDVYAVAAYRVYLAAPLFSQAECHWNLEIAAALRACAYEVYLPQETGDSDASRGADAHQMIFQENHRALDAADLVVAVIDGADADSGTAWEMGYAYARGIPVYAIRTDFRMAGASELVNLMLEQSAVVVRSIEELIRSLPCPLPVSSPGDQQQDGRSGGEGSDPNPSE